MSKVKVHLHGRFDVVGEPLVVSANTAREAATAVIGHLRRVHPELFKERMFFEILDFDSVASLDEELEVDELHFLPAFVAGKKGGIFQIIIGAVLITASFIPGLQFLAPVGISMVLGGTLQLLTPVPVIDTAPEVTNPEASKYLSGTGNTTKIGTRIPLAYGTFPVYGQFLSINVQSKDISSGPYTGTVVYPYEGDYRYGWSSGNSINVY